jgi:asparagine synthase (glutamine-hydrolysing)
MCGIAGILVSGGAAEADVPVIEAMTRALAHRGPNAHRTLVDGPIRLGHRRLAVIDPGPHADQPMASADGTLQIVFNGEIYNHDDERRRLSGLGHRFRTRTDTEVVLALYREHGEECVAHLRGMFAFGIWDSPRRRLFLARDRFGKKPLYYSARGGRFAFASEIKALLQDPAIPGDVDPTALHEFLSFDYVPGPGTAFRAIEQLPPAHAAVVDGRGVRRWRYWTADREASPCVRDVGEAAEGILERLRDAIRVRLMSDVPLGVFLSGGLDSSAIVALLRQLTTGPIHTFALGFEEPGRDERPAARLVADRFDTEHHEFAFRPDLETHLDAVVAHYDQPFSDPSMLPTWELARQARSSIVVALTGEGGDEWFAGYDRYVKMALAARWYRVPAPVRRAATATVDRLFAAARDGGLPRRLRDFFALGRQPQAELFARFLLHFDHTLKRRVYTPAFWDAVGGRDAADGLRVRLDAAPGGDAVNALLDVDAESYLPDDLLVKVDMATMRHGLEARCPFLDPALVQYVRRLPGDWKLHGVTTKWILRRALRGLLPASVVSSRKRGFGPPVHRWLRGALRQRAYAVLTDRRTEQRGYFDPVAVRTLLDDHASGRRNYGHELWNLLVLELWHRAVVDRG